MAEGEETREYPPFHERDDTIGVSDQYDMVTKFAMEQNLSHYGYGTKLNHLNKNLLFTNLKREHDEPQLVINQLKNITILKRFSKDVELEFPTGRYEEVDATDEKVVAREVFVKRKVEAYRYRNLIDYFSTKMYGITSTAAGTNAKLLETLKSTFLHKEQTIEDRTETKGGVWNNLKGKKG